MKTALFRDWDWEQDRGVTQITSDEASAGNFAEALFDWRGLVYRVFVHDSRDKFAYDYFYDDKGHIVEKRSLDETGQTVIIVRYEYDGDRKVAEVGWPTKGEQKPKRVNCSS
jgi:hypothetical protein